MSLSILLYVLNILSDIALLKCNSETPWFHRLPPFLWMMAPFSSLKRCPCCKRGCQRRGLGVKVDVYQNQALHLVGFLTIILSLVAQADPAQDWRASASSFHLPKISKKERYTVSKIGWTRKSALESPRFQGLGVYVGMSKTLLRLDKNATSLGIGGFAFGGLSCGWSGMWYFWSPTSYLGEKPCCWMMDERIGETDQYLYLLGNKVMLNVGALILYDICLRVFWFRLSELYDEHHQDDQCSMHDWNAWRIMSTHCGDVLFRSMCPIATELYRPCCFSNPEGSGDMMGQFRKFMAFSKIHTHKIQDACPLFMFAWVFPLILRSLCEGNRLYTPVQLSITPKPEVLYQQSQMPEDTMLRWLCIPQNQRIQPVIQLQAFLVNWNRNLYWR